MIGSKKKEGVFYEMFIDFAAKIVTAAESFADLVNNFQNVEDKVAHMKVMETECDMEVHKILKTIHTVSVTPLYKEDMYSITKEMDEIVDCIEEAANGFLVFDIKEIKTEAKQMADMTLQAIKEVEVIFKHLPEVKKNAVVMEQIIEVNRIENEGDIIYRKALKTLFKEGENPVELIKWKHLFDHMEESLDACERVANLIEGVIMKYA